jgi:hypothetical protein
MAFKLTAAHLRLLWEANCFPVPMDHMVFFGLRGCLPLDDADHEFSTEHTVELAEPDYTHPRCTLGQWYQGKVALFAGSTVPHRKYIEKALARNGVGTNQMMTGLYKDYRKGRHKAGGPTEHEAFVQTDGRPIRRTADDFDYDEDDRVEFSNPYDNLHAAWSMGVNDSDYGSAGCQVVVGYPQCPKRGAHGEVGPWKLFRQNAYRLSQDSFPYVLLTGRDALHVTQAAPETLTVRLRYGSQGPVVMQLQEALKRVGFYEGEVDGDFGKRTAEAVLAYQTARFGPHSDDGIVGPITAESLGLSLPKLQHVQYGERASAAMSSP